jgi:glucose-1-phosphatase
MDTISAVIFDLDDVLCTYDRGAHISHIASLAGKTSEEVYEAIWGSGFDSEADAGLFDADDYLRGFKERIGYPLSRGEWLAGRKLTTVPNLGVLDLVSAIKRNTKIGLLTNNTSLVTDYLDDFLPALRPLFGSNIYASATLKAAKPSPESFLRCLSKLGIESERTLFVDDQESNVEGARNTGLHGHRYTSEKLLAEALTQYGLLPTSS